MQDVHDPVKNRATPHRLITEYTFFISQNAIRCYTYYSAITHIVIFILFTLVFRVVDHDNYIQLNHDNHIPEVHSFYWHT